MTESDRFMMKVIMLLQHPSSFKTATNFLLFISEEVTLI